MEFRAVLIFPFIALVLIAILVGRTKAETQGGKTGVLAGLGILLGGALILVLVFAGTRALY